MPRETLVRLLELDLPFQFIVGNGELAVLAEMNGRDSRLPARYRDSDSMECRTASPVGRRIASSSDADYPAMNISGIGKFSSVTLRRKILMMFSLGSPLMTN